MSGTINSAQDTRKLPASATIKILLCFTLLGPLIGASPWMVTALDAGSMKDVLEFVMFLGLSAFIYGLVPAAVTGGLFLYWVRRHMRLMKPALSRLKLALLGATLGSAVSFVLFLMLSPALGGLMAFSGGFAGLVCGLICYRFCRPVRLSESLSG